MKEEILCVMAQEEIAALETQISQHHLQGIRRLGVPPPRCRLVIAACIFVLHYTRKVTRVLLRPVHQRLHTAGPKTVAQYPDVRVVGAHGMYT